jgi:hypothetical protein
MGHQSSRHDGYWLVTANAPNRLCSVIRRGADCHKFIARQDPKNRYRGRGNSDDFAAKKSGDVIRAVQPPSGCAFQPVRAVGIASPSKGML